MPYASVLPWEYRYGAVELPTYSRASIGVLTWAIAIAGRWDDV